MKESNDLTALLSPHLFWDVKRASIDVEEHKAFIIKRVLEYGFWQDWLLIKDHFGVDEISQQSQQFRDLDPKALAFISQLSGVPKQKFRCYTTTQLTPQHWNF